MKHKLYVWFVSNIDYLWSILKKNILLSFMLHWEVLGCSLYDLANVVPILAKFYHQASELYEQACTRHINMVIYIVRTLNFLLLSFSFMSWYEFLVFEFFIGWVIIKIKFWQSVWQHFEKLFLFARRIEECLQSSPAEEVSKSRYSWIF